MIRRPIYRGYHFNFWAKPIPVRDHDYEFAHDGYDGPGDDRCGTGASIADCCRQIDELEWDREPLLLDEHSRSKGLARALAEECKS